MIQLVLSKAVFRWSLRRASLFWPSVCFCQLLEGGDCSAAPLRCCLLLSRWWTAACCGRQLCLRAEGVKVETIARTMSWNKHPFQRHQWCGNLEAEITTFASDCLIASFFIFKWYLLVILVFVVIWCVILYQQGSWFKSWIWNFHDFNWF